MFLAIVVTKLILDQRGFSYPRIAGELYSSMCLMYVCAHASILHVHVRTYVHVCVICTILVTSYKHLVLARNRLRKPTTKRFFGL